MSERRAVQHWIDGAAAAGDGCERIDVVNPATATVIADVPAGTAADVDRAVAAAQRAFPEWSAVPVSERAAAIARIADGIKGVIDDFAATVTSETGSPISYAKVVQAGLPYQVASSFAALAGPGTGWDLHEYRHSSLTHLGEQGASELMLMAKSRHKKAEYVCRYFKPSPEAIARVTSLLAPGDARH